MCVPAIELILVPDYVRKKKSVLFQSVKDFYKFNKSVSSLRGGGEIRRFGRDV